MRILLTSYRKRTANLYVALPKDKGTFRLDFDEYYRDFQRKLLLTGFGYLQNCTTKVSNYRYPISFHLYIAKYYKYTEKMY